MVPIIELAESLSTITLHFTTRVFGHIAISPFLGGKKLTEKDKVFADHVTQVCEAHDRVILSFHQQVQGQRDRGRPLGTMCTCKEM